MGKWFPIWRAYFFKWVGEKPPPIEFYYEDYYKIGEACLNPSIAWQVAKLGANGYPSLKRLYWQVVSNIFYFHPDPWGRFPIWRAYFSIGLVQPPTSIVSPKFDFTNPLILWFQSIPLEAARSLHWQNCPWMPNHRWWLGGRGPTNLAVLYGGEPQVAKGIHQIWWN